MKIYDRTGEKIGTWNIIKLILTDRRKYYLIRCECGAERTANSSNIYRPLICRPCKVKNHHDTHKGERNGRMTCLGYVKVKNRHGYLILCDCGRQYTLNSYSQFMNNSACKPCSRGIYPGKRIGHSTVIRLTQSRIWEKRCDCGTIFKGRPDKTNCGCIGKSRYLKEAHKKIGLKFKMLTVKSIYGNNDGHIQLLIKCKCGTEFIRNNGHEFKSSSCGCEFSVPVGEKASNATLKNCEVISIRELYQSGSYSIEQLALMFKKSNNYMSRIVHRHVWKHL